MKDCSEISVKNNEDDSNMPIYDKKRTLSTQGSYGVYAGEGIWLNPSDFEAPYTLYHTDKYMELAQQIVEVIISPDTAIGFMHGIISVPVDLAYLTRAVFDTENNFKRQGETFRLLNAIKSGLANENNINKAINKILDCFYTYIPEKTREKIYSRIGGSVTGRAITNSVISGRIATTIAGRSSLYIKCKGGLIGNILLLGGMTERAIYSSWELNTDCPEIYNLLYPDNLDLLYFLVEPLMAPFIESIKIREREGQTTFNELMEIVVNEIKRK
ncbi:hypothetical protein AYC90_22530 [Salmonella enterica]|nr:hypothetical protein [Salmonella enterica]EAU0241717.1 hypothetical protein [Salmonella enterica]ECI4153149.1 hypothetical protein [Salmonella enterica subsp. salamae]